MFDPVINTCTENIKLPIQDKCNSYKKCLVIEDVSPFGKWTEKKCEFDDQHFDSNSQQCIDSTASTCGKLKGETLTSFIIFNYKDLNLL